MAVLTPASIVAAPTPRSSRDGLRDTIKPNCAPEYFWRYCKPVLSGLLDLAGGYSAAEKDSHLRFFHENCAQLLGPDPTGDRLMEQLIPVEMSVNISGDREKGIVRFQMEPRSVTLGPHTSPTGDDPYGRKAVGALLDYFEHVIPGLDFKWSRELVDKFMVYEPVEVARLVAAEKTSLPVPIDVYQRCPQFNYAVDMMGGKRNMKIYSIPLAKSLAAERPAMDICFAAIRSLEPYGPELGPAADALQEFLQKRCPGPMSCDYIAVDATDPKKSRVKLYISSNELNSFDFIRSVYTLGGIAMDETRLRGLEVLRSIWPLLLGVEEEKFSDSSSRPVKQLPFFLGCLYFGFEWRAGDDLPQVKLYLPLWQYHKTDRQIASAIEAVLGKLGRQEMSVAYSQHVAKTFAKADWDAGVSFHNQVSFAYSADTGPYLSIYYGLKPENIAIDPQL